MFPTLTWATAKAPGEMGVVRVRADQTVRTNQDATWETMLRVDTAEDVLRRSWDSRSNAVHERGAGLEIRSGDG